MSNQHRKAHKPTDKDLGENPGIGTSKGTIKGGEILDDDESLDGDTIWLSSIRTRGGRAKGRARPKQRSGIRVAGALPAFPTAARST
jgi:hypothetical protein